MTNRETKNKISSAKKVKFVQLSHVVAVIRIHQDVHSVVCAKQCWLQSNRFTLEVNLV